jgi:hypothetical protein
MSSKGAGRWDLSIDNRNDQRILDIEVKTKLNVCPCISYGFIRSQLSP